MIKTLNIVSGLGTLALMSAIGTGAASLQAKAPATIGKPFILDERAAPPSAPPFPGQLKRLPQEPLPPPARRSHPSSSPRDKVGAANHAARIEPHAEGFVNAIQQYPWAQGALYQVYARPGNVTDIALQEGEQLVGPGPVAAGDTVRWMIGDTVSGSGPTSRVHILVKPVRNDLATNLVINTDRRTYHIELRANPSVYMASVSWTYPEDELIALRASQAEAERAAPVAAGLDPALLDFRYTIEGDRADWKPLRAFDDGQRVFIEFPETVAQGELPPLFVLGAKGEAELVNYRVAGRYMIVDRLFARAELRLGGRKGQKTVRIVASRKGRK
jgi:type IV secretion system protein VirB9